MTNPALAKYAARTSIHGDEFGIGGDGFMVGKNLKGNRVMGIIGSGLNAGQSYAPNQFRHNELFEDFLGKTLSGRIQALHGSDGSAAAAIVPALGGVLRLTTGAGSSHTMAVNGAQMTSELNFEAANSGLICELRLGKISALISQTLFFGLTDNAALEDPFTLSGASLTSNATDAVGFLQDASGTNTHLNLVGVKNDVDATVQALTNDVDTAAFHIYRVEVDKLGNAMFYIDGVQVGTLMSNALTPTVPLTPTVAIFSEATSGSQTIDIDYSWTTQLRV